MSLVRQWIICYSIVTLYVCVYLCLYVCVCICWMLIFVYFSCRWVIMNVTVIDRWPAVFLRLCRDVFCTVSSSLFQLLARFALYIWPLLDETVFVVYRRVICTWPSDAKHSFWVWFCSIVWKFKFTKITIYNEILLVVATLNVSCRRKHTTLFSINLYSFKALTLLVGCQVSGTVYSQYCPHSLELTPIWHLRLFFYPYFLLPS